MDPKVLDAIDRVPHGGTADRDVIEFSANVNPLTPPGTRSAFESAFGETNRYPDDEYPEFRQAAAAYIDRPEEAIIPTAGGLGGLRLAIGVSTPREGTVAIPEPGFGEYEREVRLQGGHPMPVPEQAIVDLEPADYAAIIVCNPNNPTGFAYDEAALNGLADRCRSAGVPLIVDEAFLGFTERPSMAGRPGTIVVRSLTKLFGIPGIRVGFVVAPEPHRSRIRTARQPWALSVPAATVGTHVLRATDFVEATRARVARERSRVAAALEDRYTVRPSVAPFLLLGVRDRPVESVIEEARAGGIEIRDARTFRTLDRHVRVAIRLPTENDAMIDALGGAPDDPPAGGPA